MRFVTDKSGKLWSAYEIGRHGVGARAEGDHLPEPTIGTVVFESSDGSRVTRETAAGQIERMTEAALLGLLEGEEDWEDV